MNATRRRRLGGRPLALAAATVAGTAGLVWLPHVAGADSGAFSVTARADAASVEVIDPSAPVVPGGQVVYASPATAQAVLDSLGSSRAFAGAPYAGDFLVNLPGVINALSGGPRIPDYPFYVASDYPTRPAAERRVGVNGVVAQSSDRSSTGEAQVGLVTGDPDVAAAVSRARTGRDSGGVLTAEAISQVDPLVVGDVLRLGRITSAARVVAEPGQPPRKETAMAIASITIAGQEVTVTKDGISAGGGKAPLPGGAEALGKVLAAAGIQLEYVPARETETSVTSASLRVTWSAQIPGRGLVRTAVTLGQVSAAGYAEPLASSSIDTDPTPIATADDMTVTSGDHAGGSGMLSTPATDPVPPLERPSGPPAEIGRRRPGTVAAAPAATSGTATALRAARPRRTVVSADGAPGAGMYAAIFAAGLPAVVIARLFRPITRPPGARSLRPAAAATPAGAEEKGSP